LFQGSRILAISEARSGRMDSIAKKGCKGVFQKSKGFSVNPHFELNHPEAIEFGYQMKVGMLHIEIPTKLVGDSLKSWSADCTLKYRLEPKPCHLYWQNPQTSSSVESSTFAACYLASRSDL
jgi:hypothetical protein